MNSLYHKHLNFSGKVTVDTNNIDIKPAFCGTRPEFSEAAEYAESANRQAGGKVK